MTNAARPNSQQLARRQYLFALQLGDNDKNCNSRRIRCSSGVAEGEPKRGFDMAWNFHAQSYAQEDVAARPINAYR